MLCELGRTVSGLTAKGLIGPALSRGKAVFATAGFKRFLADRSGNISTIFFMIMLPLVLFVGVMTDFGRAYIARQQISTAIDASALVGGRTFDATGDLNASTQAAQAYFVQVLPKTVSAQLTSVKADSKGNVSMSASTNVPTLFLAAAGIGNLNVKTQVTSLAVDTPAKDLEVALVMDVTGSMADNKKLDNAKLAAQALVNTLLPASGVGSRSVRISIVPFSEAVNAGSYAPAATGVAATQNSNYACTQSTTTCNFKSATCTNWEGYNSSGYDTANYDKHGYTKTNLSGGDHPMQDQDKDGYDHNGYDRHGFDRNGWDHYGYDSHHTYHGTYRKSISQEDDAETGDDNDSFGNGSTNSVTDTHYDSHGYNRAGYDRNGYDHEGFDVNGYDNGSTNLVSGSHGDGVKRDHHNCGQDGFDTTNHDREGYDRTGYDATGLDRNGCDHSGHDKFGNLSPAGINPMQAGQLCAAYAANPCSTANVATTCTRTTYLTSCMSERQSSTGHAYDDASPSTSPFHAFTTTNSASTNCATPAVAVTPLTNDPKVLSDAIKALVPAGGTAGHLGTAWGWYTVSPNWSSFWPAASVPKPAGTGLMKVVIIMTDGAYNTHYDGSWNEVYEDTSSTPTAGNGRSSSQALSICTNMKAAGIEVFTMGVELGSNSTAQSTLQSCASPADTAFATHFYNVVNNQDPTNGLVPTFQTIATQIAAATGTGNQRLRITK